ncbi:MAG: integrase arm-type DNA-binding domain-containing protein [Burkholderiaceae bacterium]
MLTNAAAKAAAPMARAYKLADAGGLHLFVAPTGTKTWRLKYRWRGREKLLTIGRYPDVSLPAARMRREAAKEQLRGGVDPGRQAAPIGTFEQLARAWFAHNVASWSPAHAADVLASLERDLFPAVGKMGIASIEPPVLLAALRAIEARGCIETARRLRQRLSDIFRYAIAEGLADKDPAAALGAAMREPPPARPQPALSQIGTCRALLEECDRTPARPVTRLASRFLALTAVRLDAVRGMRWGELEDLEGDAPLWRVPPARMKLKRAKKNEERFAHLVPLSRQAVAVLRAAAAEIGHDTRSVPAGALVFPGRDGVSPIGEGAIGDLYDRALRQAQDERLAGARHVPHGWRSSFSTILNEQLGEDWSVSIDKALAHSPENKVEAAYNRAQRLARRRELFDRWGEMLA